MAFGSKPTAEELIGMSPEELKSQLGEITTLKSRLEEISGQTTSKLDSIASALDGLKPQPKTDDDEFDDPNKDLNDRLNPLRDQTLANTIMIQHQRARESFPTDFQRWGAEIAKKVSEYSAENQCDPRVWKQCVLVVRGEHAADIEKDGWQQKPSFLEPVAAGLRSDPNKGDNLNSAQRVMVEKLRFAGPVEMTPDKYRKGSDRLAKARLDRLGSMGRAMQEA